MKKKLAGLDMRLQIGGVVVGLLLVGFLAHHFVVAPQGAKAAKIQTQIDATQTQIYQRKADLKAAGKPPTIAVADLFKLSRAMPDRSDMPGIILTLSQVAREAGISFQLIEPVVGAPADTTASGYQTQRIHLLFNGDFYGLSDFLYRLRSLVVVHDGKLAASGPALQHRHGHLQRPAGRIPEHLRRALRERVRLPACAARSSDAGHDDRSGHDDDALDGHGAAPEWRDRGGGESLAMAAKKKVDPIKQREKRAKIAAIGGVVLLLAVAAWQGPKMMKLMNQKPVVPPTSAAAPVGTSALPGTGAQTTTTASGELADTDVPPAALDGGQLVSFDVFQTKDPFRPQVTSADVAAADAAASGATETQSAPGTGSRAASSATTPPSIEVQSMTTPATAVPSTAVPSTAAAPSTPETTTTAKPAAPTVSISVNGATSHVARGGAFPSSTPVFRLVSWTKGAARIGIVGGSYSTGDPTLELTIDKPVTLQNTSNGQRYKLVLLSTP